MNGINGWCARENRGQLLPTTPTQSGFPKAVFPEKQFPSLSLSPCTSHTEYNTTQTAHNIPNVVVRSSPKTTFDSLSLYESVGLSTSSISLQVLSFMACLVAPSKRVWVRERESNQSVCYSKLLLHCASALCFQLGIALVGRHLSIFETEAASLPCE